ncbi:TetR/AcrR family transcriptional regulator [Nocardia sp. NBC_01503]|uniref:TetR/AcrR family transcriptional regulator n=1 Tax=Nocardia sp. NBC_01503 TaxID=2975997 RepID=UPI002E7B9DA9|nr:TetR/AcrR family transcriptional regulator [Nocardia sp. NBC_01503]WTL33418.1 TetR/AcrR family transcriptional regulator [Nocardia sp. NBC_01503]
MVSGPERQTLPGPVRGTRPANRRELIVLAASDLFYRKGYTTVGMGEVAEAVAIGPSALYRHFRGKQDMLATVVADALATVEGALGAATPADVGTGLATAALAHRRIGVLWRREARHLSADNRAELRAASRRIIARLTELVRERRPASSTDEADLLARCALAVVNSVSFHSLSLPEPGFTTLLGELVSATIDAPISLPEPTAPVARAGVLSTRSRREAILTEAAKLFARKGFAGVGIEDIGAAVGIAGPSVYNHFTTKAEILTAAVLRGDEWLRMDMNRAFAQATDPRDGLHRLLRSYRAFTFENPDLVQILLSEAMHLPEPDRQRGRAAQHAYIAEWVHLAVEVHPRWDPIAARIRVQAAQTLCNEIALTPHLAARSGIEAPLLAIGDELLGIADR